MTTNQFLSDDTICAISTPHGVGGIAVARVSGPEAIEIADRIWKGKRLPDAESHTAHLGTIVNQAGEMVDQAVATVFRNPRSFTGEDVVEISVHGSRFIQRELLRLLIEAGARMAEPGEFTRRAFLSGKMDLAEAEAVADMIASDSRAAHRIAVSQLRGDYSKKISLLREKLIDLASLLELELDFSEEEVEFASRKRLREIASEIYTEITRLHDSFAAGRAIKEGIPVAIVGATNAGKSSLLNALLGDERAIVSDIHGTTRDTIEETISLGDYMFRFIDTAGIRHTTDEIERIGIERSLAAAARARIVILVIDPSAPVDETMIHEIMRSTRERDELPAHLIAVINKTDLNATKAGESAERIKSLTASEALLISAREGMGIETLAEALVAAAERENGSADEGLLVTNERHARAFADARESILRVIEALDCNLSGDLIALDLRQTIHHLSSITGDIPTSTLLSTIFSRFCIGK